MTQLQSQEPRQKLLTAKENVILDFTIPKNNDSTTGILNNADFYVLMPSDNTDTVAPNTDVDFPQDSPNSGTDISRITTSSFNLSNTGTCQVFFKVLIIVPGKLELKLNEYTVVDRATGSSQIVGMFCIKTTSINSVLTVKNPTVLIIKWYICHFHSFDYYTSVLITIIKKIP